MRLRSHLHFRVVGISSKGLDGFVGGRIDDADVTGLLSYNQGVVEVEEPFRELSQLKRSSVEVAVTTYRCDQK